MRAVTPDEVLEVARVHGTLAAMTWSSWSRSRVVALRQRVDGYDRGRGRSTRAELEAAKVREDCDCPRCRQARGINQPRLTADQQAMVEANVGLIGFWLDRMQVPEATWEDQFQDGMFGLMRAAQLFDPDRGYRFSTYATNWIKQTIMRGRATLNGKGYRQAVTANGGKLQGLDWAPPVSLDVPLGDDQPDGLGMFLSSSSDTEAEALGRYEMDRLLEVLAEVCHGKLDRAVLTGIANGKSYASIARELGRSPQAIQQRFARLQQRIIERYNPRDLAA